MTKVEVFDTIDEMNLSPRKINKLKVIVELYTQALLQQAHVSGWQEFPAQKPKVGELTVMKFDDVGFFVQHYWDGLEEKYGPFQKFTFIQLPVCR